MIVVIVEHVSVATPKLHAIDIFLIAGVAIQHAIVFDPLGTIEHDDAAGCVHERDLVVVQIVFEDRRHALDLRARQIIDHLGEELSVGFSDTDGSKPKDCSVVYQRSMPRTEGVTVRG